MIDFIVFWLELAGVATLVMYLVAVAVLLYFTVLVYLEDIGVEPGWTRW